MNVHRTLRTIALVAVCAAASALRLTTASTAVEKCETNYGDVSTAPSGVKLTLIDEQQARRITAILRSDDFFNYIGKAKGVTQLADYVAYMRSHEGKDHVIAIDELQTMIADRWRSKKSRETNQEFFTRNFVIEKDMTLADLGVSSRNELLSKYFDWRPQASSGTLKAEYFEQYTRNPAFLGLIIDLGFSIAWGDIAPVLTVNRCDTAVGDGVVP